MTNTEKIIAKSEAARAAYLAATSKSAHPHWKEELWLSESLIKAVRALEKQKNEWLCEIKEEWPDSSHGTYLMQNIYAIDHVLREINKECE